ncbi:MAG TPA: intein-containing recombinase RecA, partial [Longimicrobium sp.]
FYASLRIDIRRIGSIKDKEVLVGNKTRAKIVKNKVAPPFKQADFDIMFNVGIDHYGIIVDLGVENEVVQKSGAWFSYGDVRLGQGRENAKQFLQENPQLAAEVEAKVKDILGMRGVNAAADGDGGSSDD